MPTIIDSLIVKLGLDPKDFNSNKDKVKGGLKDLSSESDKTQKSFSNVAFEASKFLAVIGGTVAIQQFIEHTITTNSALHRLSVNLAILTDDVSAWSNATALAGGSAEGLQGSIDMLSRAQTELQLTGQSSLIPYFSALGLSLADASGKARPVTDILLDLSERFSALDRPTANNLGRMMGVDQGTMQLLLSGRKEVELVIKKQKEFAATTKQQGEEAQRLYRALTEIKQGFHAFGLELLSNATPALESLLSKLRDLGAWVLENKEFVKTFLAILTAGLAGVALAVAPINLVILAVTGLAGAIALLTQDFNTWKRGGETFIDWKKWEPGFLAAEKGINFLKDLLTDLVYRSIAAGDALGAVFRRDWDRVKFAWEEFKKGALPEMSKPTIMIGSAGTESTVMEFFQKQGWTKEQAAGITANIKRESNFNHQAVGDNGKAFGIAQWHPDRQAEFQKTFGKPIQQSTLDEQLQFVQYELTIGKEKAAGDKLKKTSTAADAGAVVSKFYERPANKEEEAAKRGMYAENLLGIKQAGLMDGVPGAGQITNDAARSTISTTNSTTVENNIGEINIHTQATDAEGIAKDIGGAMDSLKTSQANYGSF